MTSPRTRHPRVGPAGPWHASRPGHPTSPATTTARQQRGRTSAPPQPFPFIVGCGRSGTTMVRAIFDSHSQLAVPSESWFIPRFAADSGKLFPAGSFDAQQFVDGLLADRFFRRWGLDRAELLSALAQERPSSYPDAVRSVFRAYARAHGKPRYGDKTPGYVLAIPRLAKLFPEARFLHVVRDGRDVATSFLSVPFGPGSVESAAVFWSRRVAAGRAAGRRLGPARYREVRYEDLVEEPERIVAQLCEFLDLCFEPGMLRYFERAEAIMAGGSPGAHVRLALPPTRRARNWRTVMQPTAIASFELIAGETLSATGYDRDTAAERDRRPLTRARRLAMVGAVEASAAREGLVRRLRPRWSGGGAASPTYAGASGADAPPEPPTPDPPQDRRPVQ